ncbi:MAG TPA: amidohydrolase [Vicinamibacterales bacterium]|nr:amidohydrolase [Vicinamibacterales bacterium]
MHRWIVTLAALAAACRAPETAQPKEVSLVVSHGLVVTMEGNGAPLADGAVAIDGPDIVAVDTTESINRQFRGRETLDAAGQVVMPGLVNTHTHAPMVLYRGLADDRPLEEWLNEYIFPAEAGTVSPEFVRAGTRLAALEMIQSGTTTFADMYYFEQDIAGEVKSAGLRGVLGQTVIRFPVPDAKTPADGLARAESFITAYRSDPLITPAVAPHAVYTLDSSSLTAARDLSRRYNVPTIIHLAETRDEVRNAQQEFKATPVSFLDRLGFLGPGVLAAHGVWVSESDIAVLKARGVGVAHNPESNMKLASGTAPLTGYLRAGVPVGLGTDGAASNNDLDMFEAMRIASFLQKVQTLDPKAASAREMLELATIGGARSLGMADRIGSLAAGKRADLIVVRMTAARQTPMYDPVSQLVYTTRGDDVTSTVVNGRVLMRNRIVLSLDAAAVLKEAASWADRVRAAVTGSGSAAK